MIKSNFTPLLDKLIVKGFTEERKFKKPIIQSCYIANILLHATKKPISGKQVLNRYYKIRNRYEKI